MGQVYPTGPAFPPHAQSTIVRNWTGGLFVLAALFLSSCVDEPVVHRAAGEICSTSGVPADAPGHAICKQAVAPSVSMAFAETHYSERRAKGDHLARMCFNTGESVSGADRTCAYRCLAPAHTQTVTVPATQQCRAATTL